MAEALRAEATSVEGLGRSQLNLSLTWMAKVIVQNSALKSHLADDVNMLLVAIYTAPTERAKSNPAI